MNFETRRQLVRLAELIVMILFCVSAMNAQDPQISQINAPPPIKVISKQERAEIEKAHDNKQRLHLTIEMANTHLTLAEQHTAQQNYEAASSELGSYHALIENALTFLGTLKHDSNKTRDLYRHLELALRADGPRLTNMRRITPIEFAVRIKEVEDFARESRTQALNSFYGNTVVRDSLNSDNDKPLEKPKQEPTPKSKTP